MGAPREHPAGDSKAGDSKSEAKKTYELTVAREAMFSSRYAGDKDLIIIPFSSDLVACHQTYMNAKLKVYRNGEIVSAFPESFYPGFVFSSTVGELVTVSKTEALRWKSFESEKPVSEVMPEMKVLCSEYNEQSRILRTYAASDGTRYFFTLNYVYGCGDKYELKKFDGKEIILIARWSAFYDLMAWNQNHDVMVLCGIKLCKIKTGIVEELWLLRLKNYGRSLTSLSDCLIAVHSHVGIEFIDTKNEMKSIGEKKLENISTLLTNPGTGELIVVFNDGRINIFAVNKTPRGGVEFAETASFDSRLTRIRTAEWNPYNHSVLVMSKEGFKEIALIPCEIRAQISTHLLAPLAKITIEYLGFFKPPKPTSQAEVVDKPDSVSADWNDLGGRPKT